MRFCDEPGCDELSTVLHDDRAMCARHYLAIEHPEALAAIIREEPPPCTPSA